MQRPGLSRPRSVRSRPWLQSIESRIVPSTFTVTNLNDSGVGSLRAQIAAANANPGDDTVNFSLGGVITLTSGELAVNDGVVIVGTSVVVNANSASRVFNTSGAPAGAKITFISLAVVNGLATSDGGGILAGDEVVTVIGCTIGNNTAGGASGDGGGIAVEAAPGSLTMTGSTVSGNISSSDDGGGIYLGTGVTATVTNCSIAGNSAADEGGGLQCLSGSVILTGCTLSGNNATSGAGMNFRGTVGSGGLTIRNSTVSGNVSSTTGGGIALVSFAGTLALQNSTVTANKAGGAGGGGIGRLSGTGSISLESTVVSGNTDTAAGNEDIFTGGTLTAIVSALGTKSGITTFTPDATTSTLLGHNFKLGPLASNGGFTQTHVPAPDSPLINKGSNPAALTSDQRGGVAARNSNGGVDIGAVELQLFTVSNTNNSGAGSLRTAVTNANTFGGTDSVAFDPAVFTSPTTIKLTTGEIFINDAVTITGPAARVTLNGNAASRLFNTDGAATNADVVIQNLTLTNGVANTAGDRGGAIVVGDEALTLRNCAVTNCSGFQGGAVGTIGSVETIQVEDCVITGNSATVGGAIGTSGATVIVRRSTLSGNVATGTGGAISIGGNTSSLVVEESTLSGNTAIGSVAPAEQGGGAIYFSETATNFLISNCTLSGNSASQSSGGAVCLHQFIGTAIVRNSTITGNSASLTGGGIARVSGTGGLTLSSTIVAGNTNTAAPDLSFDTSTNVICDHSLVGVADGVPLIGSGNFSGSKASPLNAKLGPLQNNGGPTQTHFLLVGSPCIDTGANPAGLTTDQRGPGFVRVRGTAADIGAVEVNQSVIVTNANDAGAGSLRAALANANAQVGADTVTFDPAFFNSVKVITLVTGEIPISEAVTISGPSAQVVIDGNAGGRIFNTSGAPAKTAVVVQNLILTGGNVVGRGGAILVGDEALSLLGCTILNSTASVFGGAVSVANATGSLLIQDCTLSGNSATTGGGGAINLDQASSVTIRRSSITGNTAADSGGALYFSANGTLVVEDSTLSGNIANVSNPTSGGGAIYFYGTASKFQITNSTLSGNTATQSSGGGVCLVSFGGTALFQNCTVTSNVAGQSGGGIARPFGSTGAVSLVSTIVAGNTNTASPDLFFNTATTLSANHSLIGVADAGNFTLTGSANLSGTKAAPLNAKLGSLTSNGGPTDTHALLAGSPALNAGSNPIGLAADQRGTGFARTVNGAPDIGAFEVQTPPPCVVNNTVLINGGAAQRSRVTSMAVPFDQLVTLPANAATAFQLIRQTDNVSVGLTAAVNNSSGKTVVTLSFSGTGTDFGSLADGRYTLNILAAQAVGPGGALDGNCDGKSGDNFVLIGTPANGLFRHFGDADGNGTVSASDFNAFRLSYGTSGTSMFDFDNDGQVSASDFNQFRLRYGITIQP